ncbi:uncharacterized protein LOC132341526 isoform X1 [Haemorhous mexicanus]|uniref:uncharacterized protein LOC132341526 isoform X1 n=1 Tax=Haemorhous mexicanus TaxID=30427 RepID=UPI0028BE9277|nr:uncharacterized protein LOC132341526 isoform X1 [Haemorhous mexicanus]XP_059729129.1 uncharacterized protein LOC132341526 isoform X1 [Haemorhous mexicanus]
MLLRSGRRKPYQVPPRRRQSVKKKDLLQNTKTVPVFCLRKTLKCYILTEDSKTVHFDIDEDGHHEISTKDSQSHEDIAWLSVFTRTEEQGKTDSKNLVSLTQRSKLNEFVLLCKGKKHLSLKVLKASCSEPDCPSVERSDMKTCSHEDPDFKQLSEDNNFFIMHYQGESVQFQCYEDERYYLCVNDDSLDIRKLENKKPNDEKNFYFRVSYLQEK